MDIRLLKKYGKRKAIVGGEKGYYLGVELGDYGLREDWKKDPLNIEIRNYCDDSCPKFKPKIEEEEIRPILDEVERGAGKPIPELTESAERIWKKLDTSVEIHEKIEDIEEERFKSITDFILGIGFGCISGCMIFTNSPIWEPINLVALAIPSGVSLNYTWNGIKRIRNIRNYEKGIEKVVEEALKEEGIKYSDFTVDTDLKRLELEI